VAAHGRSASFDERIDVLVYCLWTVVLLVLLAYSC
jgi:hypothetical protein